MEMDEDEETIKIVQLVKSNEPLVSTVGVQNDLALALFDYFTHTV